MPLYTGRGDDGDTDLFGGGRVPKHDLRVSAYGSVDELNATIGLAMVACEGGDERLNEILLYLQDRAFVIGADLATPPGGPHEDKITRIATDDVRRLEVFIDEVDGDNDPLRTFILPGGCELAARLHVCRSVSRRAERDITSLHAQSPLSEAMLHTINRISDLLFAMARAANRLRGLPDRPWP